MHVPYICGLLEFRVKFIKKTVKPSPTSALSSSSASISVTPKDEIYIDDESIEGSGGRSGLHDDLEKDPDYSGSGFGPDDEDSSTNLQQSHRGSNSQTHSGKHNTINNHDDDNNDDLITSRTHHQTNSGTIIGTNSGSNSGIIGGNSGSNTGLNTIATTSTNTTKHLPSSSTPTNQSTPNTSTTAAYDGTANKNRDSSLYPTNTNQVQQTHLPAAPRYPTGSDAHPDDEDFDLDEGADIDGKKEQHGGSDNDDGLFVGSGDGGFIDHTDDDDDHTGDVDDDDDDDRIQRPHQPKNDLGIGSKPTSNFNSSTTSSSTTSSSSSPTTSTTERKQILSGNGNEDDDDHDDNNEDDEEDDYDDDNKGDDEDDGIDVDDDDNDLVAMHEEDENTKVYIDGTESNAKGDDSLDNERGNTNQGNTIHELDTNNINSQPTDTKVFEHTTGNDVLIMDTSGDDRTASFFAQPGILAAVIGGAVVGLLCAILVVMFIVYRMRKKDEGSYALDEPKRSPAVNSYAKNANNREFFA
ncbi:syndecan-like [Eurosta solidaginis]|uniref:syndecan-like n=1 Tax=Eurosta solidaginis TaxID=178769 RepID=UPI003530EEB9